MNTSSKPLALSAALAAAAMIFTLPASAQFSSGSDGSDGALHVQNGDPALQIQEDGVHQYTTITVEADATLRFLPNSLNTPVILLASGDVSILGDIDAGGENGAGINDASAGLPGSEAQPGPGGFPGGIGATTVIGELTYGTSGGGPGGGYSPFGDAAGGGLGPGGGGGSHFTAGETGNFNSNPAAPTYGDDRLLTLSGGSGGAGGAIFVTSTTTADGPNGGAGGGAILIASSGSITVDGTIDATGGTGQGGAGFSGGGVRGSGGGAGGAIRLMANSIGGSGSLLAQGGASGNADGGDGIVRIEAFATSGTLGQNSTPGPQTGAPTILSLSPADQPIIRITSVGGVAVSNAMGMLTMPDVTIGSGTPDPVDIVFETENVPDGAVIDARIILGTGETIDATSGPVAANTATLSVNLDASIGVIYATANFDPMP